MSKIGNNIKKIRGIKNLNQNDFANLFNLKRASIGAYEEGRAEPKLATIIEIANYFSISLDELVKKELSVNDFYKFDLFREDILKNTKHNLNPTVLPVDLVALPYLPQQNIPSYCIDSKKIGDLQTITIPLEKGKNYLAVEIPDNAMLRNNAGVGAGDILIAKENKKLSTTNVTIGDCYLFMLADRLIYRQISNKSLSSVTLHSWNPNHYDEQIDPKEIQDILEVEKVISNQVSRPSSTEQRISLIESEIISIRSQLNQHG